MRERRPSRGHTKVTLDIPVLSSRDVRFKAKLCGSPGCTERLSRYNPEAFCRGHLRCSEAWETRVRGMGSIPCEREGEHEVHYGWMGARYHAWLVEPERTWHLAGSSPSVLERLEAAVKEAQLA